MHAGGTPIIDAPNGFWIIAGSMAIVGIIISLFVARKRWLA